MRPYHSSAVIHRKGVRGVQHYLDDFLLMEAPGSRECSHALAITFSTCKEVEVPLAMDKVEPASLSLAFAYVLAPCQCGSYVRKCVRDVQTLESLVGYLVHATKVCPLAKPFLGGLFQVLRGARPKSLRFFGLVSSSSWMVSNSIPADTCHWWTLCLIRLRLGGGSW